MDKEYKFDADIQQGISQVLALCYQITTKTKFSAFMEFSGHTNQIDVRINKGKEEPDYSEPVSNRKTVYLSWDGGSTQLAELIAKLSLFLSEQLQKQKPMLEL